MRSRILTVCLLVAGLGVPDAALPDEASPPAAQAAPAEPGPVLLPAAVLVPDLRPRIYVKDLDHLAELVKEDPQLHAKARDISARKTTALTAGGVLLATGLAVAMVGATQETCDNEPAGFPPSQQIQVCRPSGGGMMVAGGLISLSGVIAGFLLLPRQDELLDVINAWNASHPDRPFELYGNRHGILIDQVAAPRPP